MCSIIWLVCIWKLYQEIRPSTIRYMKNANGTRKNSNVRDDPHIITAEDAPIKSIGVFLLRYEFNA
jgi:hypothetical protein